MVLVAMWHRETVLSLRAQESSVTGSKSQLKGKNLKNNITHTHTHTPESLCRTPETNSIVNQLYFS